MNFLDTPDARTLRAEVHSHSTFSDGFFTPEEIARRFHERGITVAALTDHDTLYGQKRFINACNSYGIMALTGVEITIDCSFHILAYGFNYTAPHLKETMDYFRFYRCFPEEITLTHRIQNWYHRVFRDSPFTLSVPSMEARITRAFGDIHEAGGALFLAHPYTITENIDALGAIVDYLQSLGLAGIEVCRQGIEDEALAQFADSRGLVKLYGTDYHGYRRQHWGDWQLKDSPFYYGSGKDEEEIPGVEIRERDMEMFLSRFRK